LNHRNPLSLSPQSSPAAPLCVPFCFLLDPHDASREHSIAGTRDMVAMLTLCNALAQYGYGIAKVCINHPAYCEPPQFPAANRLPRVPLRAGQGDCVATVTRIVTHAAEEADDRRGSTPAGTDLEAELAACWRRYFDLFKRSRMRLKPEFAALLPADYANRRELVFRQSRRADQDERSACFYRQIDGRDYDGGPRTAAFLLRLDEIRPGGPGYVGLKTVSGGLTNAWAHIVSTKLLHLLAEPGFVMAELTQDPEPQEIDPLGADGWLANVLIHHRM
jgi:hypothetical protein